MIKEIYGYTIHQKLTKLSKLKSNCSSSLVSGSYKDYVAARKAYAKEAVKDYRLAQQASGGKVEKIPLFSKLGMKKLKTIIFDTFRKKSPEEKLLQLLGQLDEFIKNNSFPATYIK